jgi:hypothetical protein
VINAGNFPCTVSAEIKHLYLNKGEGERHFHTKGIADGDRSRQSNGFVTLEGEEGNSFNSFEMLTIICGF